MTQCDSELKLVQEYSSKSVQNGYHEFYVLSCTSLNVQRTDFCIKNQGLLLVIETDQTCKNPFSPFTFNELVTFNVLTHEDYEDRRVNVMIIFKEEQFCSYALSKFFLRVSPETSQMSLVSCVTVL